MSLFSQVSRCRAWRVYTMQATQHLSYCHIWVLQAARRLVACCQVPSVPNVRLVPRTAHRCKVLGIVLGIGKVLGIGTCSLAP